MAGHSPNRAEVEVRPGDGAGYKLRKHFEKIPEQAHTETWPESLMELTPLKPCKVRGGAARGVLPTAGVLWKSVQRYRDVVRDESSTSSGAT
jgi:hypothetical protein